MLIYTQEDIDRFYNKIILITEGIDKECWKSTLYKDSHNHVRYSIGKNNIEGHRFSFMINNPEINMKGLSVCHSCDNPWCVNPDHLWLGTHQDNMNDKINKNRQAKGSQIHLAKLNEEIIENMMEDILNGIVKRVGDTSKKYQISVETISQIINKRIWTHVTKNYDMVKIKNILIKGRLGCNNINSKFADQDIRDIRIRLKNGESQSSIAKSYDVHQTTIGAINTGKTYTIVI
jgi:hypothetical protein